ncbi:MAG: 2-aminoethylphosphonate--pyruvate transaminase [Alphaproteobacteria bacterium]|nr:2-aminoethylphosphonate--pyruvate transaminase [Alphaproteobacteria bacterium]
MTERDPVLLTPGPVTTARATREAMLRDWPSWDAPFKRLTAEVCEALLVIAEDPRGFACVPLQGSGTYAVEAMIGTLVPRGGKLCVLANGAYGQRMAAGARTAGRAVTLIESAEGAPLDSTALAVLLARDAAVTHVGVVHCETGTGILNPLSEVAAIVTRAGRALLVDAISSFGALPLAPAKLPCVALAGSSNKCLEAAPGVGFVIARADVLAAAAGNSHSVALDIAAQWSFLHSTGMWRYTPPTHVVAALAAALAAHAAAGGVAARGARYVATCRQLCAGMARLGFVPLLDPAVQSPIVVAFHAPADPAYDFGALYDGLRRRGFVLYPGKTTAVESFRIGCIGAIGADEIAGLLAALAATLRAMGVRQCGPAAAANPPPPRCDVPISVEGATPRAK